MRAINWNQIEDQKDFEVWERLTTNFWLPEEIALSNDKKSWNLMSSKEKELTVKVFTGLTMLDTLQGKLGAVSQLQDAQTDHEESVLLNIAFMEAVHAKSYSYIFSTLCTSQEIADTFKWSENDPYLQEKVNIIKEIYEADCPYKRKIASVMLESFMFYSGFYLPLYMATRGKLTNTASLIRLIIRDEAIHGYYLGYKFQQMIAKLPDMDQMEYKVYAYNLMFKLYDVEMKYTKSLYEGTEMLPDVLNFLNYNANKAMMNLGFEGVFPPQVTKVNPSVMTSLAPESDENHDFFSDKGSSYDIVTVEMTSDDDW